LLTLLRKQNHQPCCPFSLPGDERNENDQATFA
jgi:hypothetical protein